MPQLVLSDPPTQGIEAPISEGASTQHRAAGFAAKTFISYSRKDLAFVDRLDTELHARGVEPLVDRQDIYAFEDWWTRIQHLIAQADTIIFVLSPDAVASDICLKEVTFALTLNKRLAPVVARPLDDAKVPAELSRLNYVFLDDDAVYGARIDGLVQALETDIGWVRRHSEYGALARVWAESGRPDKRLLRSPQLDEAESWIASRPVNAPVPTDDTQALIIGSRRDAVRRRNRLSAALAVGLALAMALTGVAIWQWRAALAAEQVAAAQRQVAERNEEIAQRNERQASVERDRALINQSRYLTDLAKAELAAGRTTRAALLTMEALPDSASETARPWHPPAEETLLDALSAHQERLLLQHSRGPVTAIEHFDSDRRFWSLSGLMFVVWDASRHEPIYSIPSGGDGAGSDRDFVGFTMLADQRSGILARHDGELTFIDVATGTTTRTEKIARLSMNRAVGDRDGKLYMIPRLGGTLISSFGKIISLSPDEKFLTALSEPNYDANEYTSTIYIYRLSDFSIAYRAMGTYAISYPTGMSFSPDGTRFFTAGERRAEIIDLEAGQPTSQLQLEYLDETDDERFSFFKSSDPKFFGFSNDGDGPVRIQGASIQPPNSVIFSRFLDRDRLLMVLRSGEIAVWAAGEPSRRALWKLDRGWAMSAVLSNDGAALAMGTSEGKIVVFDVTGTLTPRTETQANKSDVYFLKFANQDKTLLSVSRDGTARAWNLDTGKRLATMSASRIAVDTQEFMTGIISVSARASGELVTGDVTGALRTWDLAPRLKPETFRGDFNAWSSIRYTDDGRWLLATEQKRLLVYDQSHPNVVKRLSGHQEFIIGLASDPTSRFAATSSLDGTVKVWDLEAGSALHTFGTPLPPIEDPDDGRDYTSLHLTTRWQFARAIAFSLDGRLLFIGRNNGIGEVRDVLTGAVVAAFGPGGEPPGESSFNPRKGIFSAAFTPDRRYVVAGRANGSLAVKSLVDGSFKSFVIEGQAGEVTAIVAHRDAPTLSVSVASKPFSFATAHLGVGFGRRYSGHARQAGSDLYGNILRLALTDLFDGAVESKSYGPSSLGVRPESEAELAAPSGLEMNARGILLLSGKEMVGGLSDVLTQIRKGARLDTIGADIARFDRHFGTVSGIAALRDDLLLSWSHDFTVRLWNMSDRSHRAVMVGAHDEILRVAYPTGRPRRVVAGSGRSVLVWDLRHSEPLAAYVAPGPVADIAYSPDGRKVAAVTASGAIAIWEQFDGTEALLDFARSAINRCLTRVERREFAIEATDPKWCKTHKKYPFRFARLGVQLEDADDVTAEHQERRGAMVVEVVGLPALLAGLRKGDVIHQVGSRSTKSTSEVTRAVMESEIGQPLDVFVWRAGHQEKLVAQPGPED